MKSLVRICAALVCLWTAPAYSQGFGLDLSDAADEESPIPAGAASPVSAEEYAEHLRAAPPSADPGEGEDVSLGDRVKAVQRKHFLKRRRLEVVPTFAMSLNDAFYSKVGGGIALNYHLVDSLALSLHYEKFGIVQSESVRIAKRELQSLLLSSKLDWTAGVDFMWTPIYGKLAWFNTIVHYDLFLITGVGAAWSQTSGDPVGDGAHPAVNVGVGQRFSLSDWMAFEFWVKQLLYADRPQDRQISEIQKVLTLNVGLSFWIPPSFTYENQ